jgi:hypothetical protein
VSVWRDMFHAAVLCESKVFWSRVNSDARSSTYMSNGPSCVATFIQVTLSTSRMFAVTPMRATCSLMTVAMTLNTDFSVFVISSKVKGFCGP